MKTTTPSLADPTSDQLRLLALEQAGRALRLAERIVDRADRILAWPVESRTTSADGKEVTIIPGSVEPAYRASKMLAIGVDMAIQSLDRIKELAQHPACRERAMAILRDADGDQSHGTETLEAPTTAPSPARNRRTAPVAGRRPSAN